MAGSHRLTIEHVMRLARGEAWVRNDRGERRLLSLSGAEWAGFTDALRRGYVVYTGSHSRLGEIWWRWCGATGHPHVFVKPKRGYAWVELELTEPQVELTDLGENAVDRALWEYSQQGGYGFGPKGGSHPKVRGDVAEALARELLRIARSCVRRRDASRPDAKPESFGRDGSSLPLSGQDPTSADAGLALDGRAHPGSSERQVRPRRERSSWRATDLESETWRKFTGTWWDTFGEEPKRVSALNDLCTTHRLMVTVRGNGSERSQQVRLGRALLSHQDRWFGKLRITSAPTRHRCRAYALGAAPRSLR